ncbi:MAG TPA: BolA family protein [Alphaproteobacteria bacterium]|nr:BolA family protein [Alphaproteobacteria bacterium]
MSVLTDRMHAALEAAFAPSTLEIEDQSAAHAGHAGARPGGESHFHVTIVSGRFAGLPRLARHRAAQEVLAFAMAQGVHALSFDLRAPEEALRGRDSGVA